MDANDDALGKFNRGYERGFNYGAAGADGLIEAVVADKAHTFCGDCAAKRIVVAGGRTPPLRSGVASICRPA